MRSTFKEGLLAPIVALALAWGPCSAWANDSVNSELSHVVSGALIAAGAAAIGDRYGVEDRRWFGFSTSVGFSAVIEGAQILVTGPDQVGPSALDFTANLVGAALGAWVTDRYLLQPVISRDAQGRRVLGATLSMAF